MNKKTKENHVTLYAEATLLKRFLKNFRKHTSTKPDKFWIVDQAELKAVDDVIELLEDCV